MVTFYQSNMATLSDPELVSGMGQWVSVVIFCESADFLRILTLLFAWNSPSAAWGLSADFHLVISYYISSSFCLKNLWIYYIKSVIYSCFCICATDANFAADSDEDLRTTLQWVSVSRKNSTILTEFKPLCKDFFLQSNFQKNLFTVWGIWQRCHLGEISPKSEKTGRIETQVGKKLWSYLLFGEFISDPLIYCLGNFRKSYLLFGKLWGKIWGIFVSETWQR